MSSNSFSYPPLSTLTPQQAQAFAYFILTLQHQLEAIPPNEQSGFLKQFNIDLKGLQPVPIYQPLATGDSPTN